MKTRLFSAIMFLILGSFAADARQQPALFDYDRTANIECAEKSAAEKNKTILREIVYASPKGGMVTATLIEPKRKKAEKLAAVIYLHGAGANRTQFAPEALSLVETGKFAALLIDLPSARPAPWKKSEYDSLEADREMRIQTVVDARRGVDLLETLPQIDRTRLGLVGYSYGAATGGILAGIENRFSAVVLMASGGSQIEFWRNEKNPDAINLKKILKEERFRQFIATLSPVEQINYIKSSTAPLLFQFAEKDEFTSKDSMRKFYAAANQPKTVKWYDAAHELNAEAAEDRLAWLIKQLKSPKK